MKVVNSKPNMVHGIVGEVPIKIGEWQGNLDFSIVPMDDYTYILGMEFMDGAHAIPMPFVDSMCIMEKGNVCTIPLMRSRIGDAIGQRS